MTEWTPKLEKMISDYADFEFKNAKDGLNRMQTVIGSVLRVAFRTVTTRDGGYSKICAEIGVSADKKFYKEAMQKMIDLAATHDSDAADKLTRTKYFWSTLAELCPEKSGIKRIKTAKLGKIPL